MRYLSTSRGGSRSNGIFQRILSILPKVIRLKWIELRNTYPFLLRPTTRMFIIYYLVLAIVIIILMLSGGSSDDGDVHEFPIIHIDSISDSAIEIRNDPKTNTVDGDPKGTLNEEEHETSVIAEDDPNAFIDGSKGKPIDVPNWGATYDPLRVWCVVFALYDRHHEEMMVIQETWGRHCDKIFFVVDESEGEYIWLGHQMSDSTLETVLPIQTRNDSRYRRPIWEKTWKFMVYLEQNHHGEYDYLLRADIDTWFSVNNFKGYARYFDPDLSWYMGHTELHPYPLAFQAGGNYALSRGTIERLVTSVLATKEFLTARKEWRCAAVSMTNEDVMIADCLKKIGIHPLNTLNEQYQLRFSPFTQEYTEVIKRVPKSNWWYWKHRFEIYPSGKDCCDPNMIALHYYKEKDIATLRKKYEELDIKYEADKIPEIPVPQKPSTFLFGKSINPRNRDIIYRLQE